MYEAQSTRDRCVKKMRKIGYGEDPRGSRREPAGLENQPRLFIKSVKDRRRCAQTIRFSKERLPDVGAALGR